MKRNNIKKTVWHFFFNCGTWTVCRIKTMKKPIYPKETENESSETKRQESGRKITMATKPGLSEALCL